MAIVYRHKNSETGVVVSSLDEHFVMLWGESELKREHDLEAAVLILKEAGIKAFTAEVWQVSDVGKATENLVFTSYWGTYFNLNPVPGDLIAIGNPREVDKPGYYGIRIVRCKYTLEKAGLTRYYIEDTGIHLKDWEFKLTTQVKKEVRAHNEFWYRQWWKVEQIVKNIIKKGRLLLK